MYKNVLIEGMNLTLGAGTGIATYARMLGSTLRSLDYDTDVLIGTRRAVDAKDPILSEISLVDAAASLPTPIPQIISREVRRITGFPMGLKPASIQLSGVIYDPSWGSLTGFGNIHAVRDLNDMARFHFKRYGAPLTLKVPSTPSLFHATHPIPLRVPGCPNVVTVHDIIPLRLPYATLDEKKYFLNMLRNWVKRADHIVTVSEFSRMDLISLLKVPEERITNTYQAVQLPEGLLARPRDTLEQELINFFDLEFGDYFLFFGAIEPKKNVSRLIDAYASSGSKRPLIIVGNPAWQFEGDVKKMADERFFSYAMMDNVISPRRRVRHLTYLPFSRLITLMQGARAVLFPSLYEGFGLPVLEAMLAGAPVMTSNVSSLPEVAGDAALLVNPHDIDSMTAGIRTLDADDDLCADLVQRGYVHAQKFSPDRYRANIQDLYRKLL